MYVYVSEDVNVRRHVCVCVRERERERERQRKKERKEERKKERERRNVHACCNLSYIVNLYSASPVFDALFYCGILYPTITWVHVCMLALSVCFSVLFNSVSS